MDEDRAASDRKRADAAAEAARLREAEAAKLAAQILAEQTALKEAYAAVQTQVRV